MRIKITSEDVETKSGIAKKSGKPYTMHTQKAVAENARFRMPLRLTLGDDGKPHPVGEYELDLETAVAINQYGDMGWERRLTLVPVQQPAARKVG